MGGVHAGRVHARLLLVGDSSPANSSVLESLGPLQPSDPSVDAAHPESTTMRCGRHGRITVVLSDLEGFSSAGDPPFPAEDDGEFNGVVVVVDCRSQSHTDAARRAMDRLLVLEGFRGLPVLIVANTTGRRGECSISGLPRMLGMDSVWDRRWSVHAFHADEARSLCTARDWLFGQLSAVEPAMEKVTRADEPILDRIARKQHCSKGFDVGRRRSGDSDTTAMSTDSSDPDTDLDTEHDTAATSGPSEPPAWRRALSRRRL